MIFARYAVQGLRQTMNCISASADAERGNVVFLALCRSVAENEVPKIRQVFENNLRKFEEKIP